MKIISLLLLIISCNIAALEVSSGSILTYHNFASKFVVKRDIYIWLPDGYHQNKQQKYSVLYMLDGQNLFDANAAWQNQEWNVEQAATAVISKGEVAPFIIVSIQNLEELRYAEYFPTKVLDFVDNDDPVKQGVLEKNKLTGDLFLQFLVQELIPFTEKHFRVKKSKNNRAISGSSMGGLMSMYAFLEYPQVFGTALAISSHWVGVLPEHNYQPLFQGMLDYMQSKLTKANLHKRVLYFDTGTKQLDQYYPPLQKLVDSLFADHTKFLKHYHSYVFEGAGHDGKSWSERMPSIFKKLVLFN